MRLFLYLLGKWPTLLLFVLAVSIGLFTLIVRHAKAGHRPTIYDEMRASGIVWHDNRLCVCACQGDAPMPLVQTLYTRRGK